MTVNLSINDLINKNYDTSKYNDIIDNGILSLEQVRVLMIIKNVQDNRILLSKKEKEQLNNYVDKFSFNEVKDPDYDSDHEQIELVTVNDDSSDDSYESIKDPNLMTCPASKLEKNTESKLEKNTESKLEKNTESKLEKNTESEVTADGKKIYRIKYINDQNKLKLLAML